MTRISPATTKAGSRATLHEAGDLVWIAPTSAPGADLAAETSAALAALGRTLIADGLSWHDVDLVIAHLADPADEEAVDASYHEHFAGAAPRRTLAPTRAPRGTHVAFEVVAHRRRDARPGELVRRTGFVHHDGESLYYEVVGAGDATPVVLCHGAGSNHASWFQQVHALAHERPVISWDHRGYGRSSDHAEVSGPEVAAGDLLAVLDELDVERADLVGQSMGGWTAVGAALARPRVARSLVLTDSIGGIVTDPVAAALARSAARTPERGVLGEHPALSADFRHREPALAHLYQMVGRMGSVDPMVMLERLARTTYGTDIAASLTMPVLVVAGDRDTLFTPAALRAVADALPDGRLVEIADAGHSAYFEEPDSWNQAVRDFQRALDRIDEKTLGELR